MNDVVRPFWEDLLLSLVGPLLTAVIGTALVGLWASRLTQRWQERKEDAALRASLIKELLEGLGAFYVELKHYSRLAEKSSKTPAPVLEEERRRLDAVYLETRKSADATEYRLRAIFESVEAAQAWHSLIDLLTVPYFKIIGFATPEFISESSGSEHSTLTPEQLQDDELVFRTYKILARQLPSLILSARRRRYV